MAGDCGRGCRLGPAVASARTARRRHSPSAPATSVVGFAQSRTPTAPTPSITTRPDSPLQKSALRRLAGQPQRRFETAARHPAPTTPELELTARSRIERVIAEAFDVGDGGDRFEAFCWAFALCEGHGSV